jgi:CRP-like cAMP-binding protein
MEQIFDSIYKLINIASGQANAEAVNHLSPETKLGFVSILKRKEFPKGYVLSTPDRICDEVYVVEKGLICNTMLVDGKEIGAGFYAEGGIGGDIISFLTRRESKRTVKLIEPSVLWIINHHDLEAFYKKYPESERIGRLLYNYVIIIQQQRIEDLVSESAQVRYEKLIERFPEIIPRLPLNFVATFLGITQETLSRIRSQK